jgi:predicted amidohydrolase
MVVSSLQYQPAYLQPLSNHNHIERGHPALLDSDLIVLPELFATGYFFRSTDDAENVAEDAPGGPTTTRLEQWASRSGATIVAGLVERYRGRFYNSAVVVTPRGWLGTYRKVHLFYQEKVHFSAGDLGFPVWTVTDRAGKAYRLGVMICFDWYFPEAARSLALGGADVIAHPSNLVRQDCPRSMPIRALENHVFTVTANRIGTETNGDESLTFTGRSLMCDPRGMVLASASPDEETVLRAEFDPLAARDRRITATNDLFDDRRPEVYGAIVGG